MTDRFWSTELQQWVTDADLERAVDVAQLAVQERECEWAKMWLIRAMQANEQVGRSE